MAPGARPQAIPRLTGLRLLGEKQWPRWKARAGHPTLLIQPNSGGRRSERWNRRKGMKSMRGAVGRLMRPPEM